MLPLGGLGQVAMNAKVPSGVNTILDVADKSGMAMVANSCSEPLAG